MSARDDILAELAAIRSENARIIAALKPLVAEEVGGELSLPDAEDEWLEEIEDEAGEEYIVPIHAKKNHCAHVNTRILAGNNRCEACGADLGCAHNQQVLVPGEGVKCGRCGYLLNRSGVQGRDPGAPVPGEETHEASSKNPGTPLVPY